MQKSLQRIPPLPASEWTDEVRDVFTIMEGPDAWTNGSAFSAPPTMANHPALASAMFEFHMKTLAFAKVDPRLREIVMLRAAWRHQCQYEWIHHGLMGRNNFGLTDADIEAIKEGPAASHWNELERLVLGLSDEMPRTSRVSDETWAALERHFTRQEIMELVFLVAEYEMNCLTFNAIRLEIEPQYWEESIPQP